MAAIKSIWLKQNGTWVKQATGGGSLPPCSIVKTSNYCDLEASPYNKGPFEFDLVYFGGMSGSIAFKRSSSQTTTTASISKIYMHKADGTYTTDNTGHNLPYTVTFSNIVGLVVRVTTSDTQFSLFKIEQDA